MAIITLDMGPEQALELLNSHDHDNTTTPALGNTVNTGSISNNAVTEPKIADLAVSTRTIQPGAVIFSKLDASTQALITTASSGIVPGLTNFIAEGLDFTPGTGLNLTISKGRASVSEQTVTLTAAQTFSLDARMAALLYLQKNGTIGKVNAVLPAPDNNTIAQWRFNQTGAGSVIPNYAVGLSSIAVPNNLSPGGGLASVDGWTDYAIKGDGSTGYYTSANGTGFPTGASEREINVLFNPGKTGALQRIIGYGSVSNYLIVSMNAANNLEIYCNATPYDTAYALEVGKTYLITLQYNGSICNIYINGYLIFSIAVVLTTTASVITFFKNSGGSLEYALGIICFAEVRNKIHTPQQIAQMANALLLPCTYQKTSAQYPTIAAADLATAYHEYKFDEVSGTSVADSAGTLNGVATGTTIVDSGLGLGKARNFNGTTDNISLGNYAAPSNFTIMFAGTISKNAGGQYIFSNLNAAVTSGIGLIRSTVDGALFLNNGGTVYATASNIITGKPVFLVIVANAGTILAYNDSIIPETIATGITINTTSNPAYLGKTSNTASYWFNGVLEYFNIIPRALSQAEITQYYNALMKTGQSDIREVLPADSISLGRALTTSLAIKEISTDYQHGRREKAYGGNRRVFLGWKYYSGSQTLTWSNTFGTRKVRPYYTWAQDANGTNESDLIIEYEAVTPCYGAIPTNTTSNRLSISINAASSPVYFNGAWQTSGYIGCYVEVLEGN